MACDIAHLITVALSSITIFSSLFLKVPQIYSLYKLGSADGINLIALLLEIAGFSVMTLYNYLQQYSLLTYLEYPIILFQLYVMLYFVLKFRNLLENPLLPLYVAGYAVTLFFTLTGAITKHVLSCLVPLCTPLSAFAKISYMIGIIQAQNSDAISTTTWCISIFTNLVRIFTVYVDSADIKLMCNFLISAILSVGVLVTAMLHSSGENPALKLVSSLGSLVNRNVSNSKPIPSKQKRRNQKCKES